MLTLTVDRVGETDCGAKLELGMKVEYKGHAQGGNVWINMPDGSQHLANSRCFKELR